MYETRRKKSIGRSHEIFRFFGLVFGETSCIYKVLFKKKISINHRLGTPKENYTLHSHEIFTYFGQILGKHPVYMYKVLFKKIFFHKACVRHVERKV